MGGEGPVKGDANPLGAQAACSPPFVYNPSAKNLQKLQQNSFFQPQNPSRFS
jgi:hypothetical protein